MKWNHTKQPTNQVYAAESPSLRLGKVLLLLRIHQWLRRRRQHDDDDDVLFNVICTFLTLCVCIPWFVPAAHMAIPQCFDPRWTHSVPHGWCSIVLYRFCSNENHIGGLGDDVNVCHKKGAKREKHNTVGWLSCIYIDEVLVIVCGWI